jgi:hypothetical protein
MENGEKHVPLDAVAYRLYTDNRQVEGCTSFFSFYFWGCECRMLFVHRPPALSEYRPLIGSSCFSFFVEGGS